MLYEKFMCMLTIGQWKTVIIAYFSTLMTLRRLHVSIQGEAKKENIAPMLRSFDSKYMWYLMLFSLKIFFHLLSVSAETWNFCSKSKQKIFIFIQENLKNSMWNLTRTQVLSLLAFYGLSCIYVLLNENEKVDQPISASFWLYSRKTRNSKSQPEPDLPGS